MSTKNKGIYLLSLLVRYPCYKRFNPRIIRKQFRGNIKASFGMLTDDDLLQANGNADKIQGALQERYGYTTEQAQTEWDKLLQKYAATLEDLIADLNTPATDLIVVKSYVKDATQD